MSGRLAALAGLVVVIGGCELTSVEVAVPEDVVVVEAFLRPDSDSQHAFLYRTLPGDDGSLRVDGAEVRVYGPEGAPLLFSAADEERECARPPEGLEEAGSCYVSPPRPGFVRPGATYRLEVALPDGGTLTGRTTVPGSFRVVRPEPETCVLGQPSYPLVWTRSEGAWSYQVVAYLRELAPGLEERGVVDPPDELELTGLAVGSSDTTITFPGEFGVFDRFVLERDLLLALADGLPNGSRADIVFAAGDRNFVNWARGGTFNPSGQVRIPSVGGDGTGVFASLVVQRRSLVAEEDGSGLTSCP